MDLAARKYHFIKQLENVDEKLLEKLEALVALSKKDDWFLSLSKEEQDEIEDGIKEADNGTLEQHESVMKIFDKWR
jgi:predicted transcriptional regulator